MGKKASNQNHQNSAVLNNNNINNNAIDACSSNTAYNEMINPFADDSTTKELPISQPSQSNDGVFDDDDWETNYLLNNIPPCEDDISCKDDINNLPQLFKANNFSPSNPSRDGNRHAKDLDLTTSVANNNNINIVNTHCKDNKNESTVKNNNRSQSNSLNKSPAGQTPNNINTANADNNLTKLDLSNKQRSKDQSPHQTNEIFDFEKLLKDHQKRDELISKNLISFASLKKKISQRYPNISIYQTVID